MARAHFNSICAMLPLSAGCSTMACRPNNRQIFGMAACPQTVWFHWSLDKRSEVNHRIRRRQSPPKWLRRRWSKK